MTNSQPISYDFRIEYPEVISVSQIWLVKCQPSNVILIQMIFNVWFRDKQAKAQLFMGNNNILDKKMFVLCLLCLEGYKDGAQIIQMAML